MRKIILKNSGRFFFFCADLGGWRVAEVDHDEVDVHTYAAGKKRIKEYLGRTQEAGDYMRNFMYYCSLPISQRRGPAGRLRVLAAEPLRLAHDRAVACDRYLLGLLDKGLTTDQAYPKCLEFRNTIAREEQKLKDRLVARAEEKFMDLRVKMFDNLVAKRIDFTSASQ